MLVITPHGLLGNMQNPIDVTYLADTVVTLRLFEADGAVHKAVSVIKKRIGTHENTIRKLSIDGTGIIVGPPLVEFRGVLTGVPTLIGEQSKATRRVDEQQT